MPGIQRAKRKTIRSAKAGSVCAGSACTIRLSQITTKAIDESDKEQLKPEDPTIPEADDEVEGIQEEQFGGEDTPSRKQEFQPQDINFNKFFPKEILDKLLLALAYGFNTNLGYYNPKFGNYQIMNSKYMVDMKESVLADSKRPPKYVIYYQAIHLADKNETNFQIVSEITEPILVQLVQQKKDRTARNVNIDWDAIKKAVDAIKSE